MAPNFKFLPKIPVAVFLIPFPFAFYIDADPSAVEKKSSILTLLVLLFILFLKSNKDSLPGPSLLEQHPFCPWTRCQII